LAPGASALRTLEITRPGPGKDLAYALTTEAKWGACLLQSVAPRAGGNDQGVALATKRSCFSVRLTLLSP
jgi:hypothetical protein